MPTNNEPQGGTVRIQNRFAVNFIARKYKTYLCYDFKNISKKNNRYNIELLKCATES